MWLRSGVDVAVGWAGGYSSDSTPSLVTSMCCGCGPKKTKTKQNKTKQKKVCLWEGDGGETTGYESEKESPPGSCLLVCILHQGQFQVRLPEIWGIDSMLSL